MFLHASRFTHKALLIGIIFIVGAHHNAHAAAGTFPTESKTLDTLENVTAGLIGACVAGMLVRTHLENATFYADQPDLCTLRNIATYLSAMYSTNTLVDLAIKTQNNKLLKYAARGAALATAHILMRHSCSTESLSKKSMKTLAIGTAATATAAVAAYKYSGKKETAFWTGLAGLTALVSLGASYDDNGLHVDVSGVPVY